MSYGAYYRHYLSLHQNRNCRRLHLFGMAVSAVLAGVILWCLPWWLVPAAPLAVYPFAWCGHLLFERNTPATWKNPLFAAVADLNMTWDIVRGRLAL